VMSSSLEISDEEYQIHTDDLGSNCSREVLDFVSDTDFNIDPIPKKPVGSLFPGLVVIGNLPLVKKDKKDKLMAVLAKATDFNDQVPKKNLPIDPNTGQSYGYCIVEYENETLADQAVSSVNGLPLDTKHTLTCVKFDTLKTLFKIPTEVPEYVGPSRFSRMHLGDWIADSKCREQILLRYQDETEVHWHDPIQSSLVLNYGGAREKKERRLWCDGKVEWSPMGNYLVTFHKQGLALWGNGNFDKVVRFAHQNVKYAMFSPEEDYLMTWNGTHPSEVDLKAVRFFNVLTGLEIGAFSTPTCLPTEKGPEFPHFLWNYDGKYVAKMTEKEIKVYELPSLEPVKDEHGKELQLRFEGISSFAWSPTDNILSIWVKERGDVPARVWLIEIPSRKEIASRSRTQCDTKMIWQNQGDYLCLNISKLAKTTKNKEMKKKGASVEIFRLKETHIPVESLELKDSVKGFFWETSSNRFALITEPETGNPRLMFYSLSDNKCALVQDMELPSAAYNELFWAPEGQYFVVAAIPGGDLLWGHLSPAPENRLEILYKDEHFMLNFVSWDPSSRYIITGVNQPMMQPGAGAMRYQMESGFCIWTFQGRLLYRQQKEKLYKVAWRPHPKSFLQDKQKASDVRKKLKDYSKKYDAVDEKEKEEVRAEQKKFRQDKIRDFFSHLERFAAQFEKEAAKWQLGYDELDKNSKWETRLEQEEVVLEEKMELLNANAAS